MKKVMKSMKVKGKNHAKGKALTKGPRKGQLPTQVAMVNPCPWKRKWSSLTKKGWVCPDISGQAHFWAERMSVGQVQKG